jgi:micrococcal nuclease
MRYRLLLVLIAALVCSVPPNDLGAQQRERMEDARFVASSRGQVYYWIGCDGWKGLSPANLRWFRTAADAEAAGYRPSRARDCAPHFDTAPIAAAPGGSAECVVARIIDGDTFVCDGGSHVRLLIADTPERGQDIYADSATMLLERLMPVGVRVRLEFDVGVMDRYRRLLAYVFADSIFINRELVRRGLAHVAIHPPNVRHVDTIRAAADSARLEGLGLWRGSALLCSPAEYRAGRCR